MNPNDTRKHEDGPVLQEQTLLQEITPASPEANTESVIKELPDISVPPSRLAVHRWSKR